MNIQPFPGAIYFSRTDSEFRLKVVNAAFRGKECLYMSVSDPEDTENGEMELTGEEWQSAVAHFGLKTTTVQGCP